MTETNGDGWRINASKVGDSPFTSYRPSFTVDVLRAL
jgi:hypothetical protein